MWRPLHDNKVKWKGQMEKCYLSLIWRPFSHKVCASMVNLKCQVASLQFSTKDYPQSRIQANVNQKDLDLLFNIIIYYKHHLKG